MNHPTPGSTRPSIKPAAALWLSAFILLGLLVVQLGRLAPTFTPIARADMVSRVGEQSILTFNAGNDEALAVLDARSEQLLVYRIRSRNNFELVKVYSLPDLFVAGERMLKRTNRPDR